jgi:NAD(P)-dependent dehydrogenase (short-subunit alcohol dehydrogenase family)
VAQALLKVGLDPARFSHRSWRELSGGEAQRVALAARLVLEPKVLLLDEPTASVDRESSELILRAALDARDRWGTTLIIISHQLTWLRQIADRILSMDYGKLSRVPRHGKVISISSIAGLFGNAGQTNYAAAKAGLVAMTKTWAKEYGKRGITFNVVAPGLIESPMTEGLPEKDVQRFKDAVPLGILGTPADVAKVVLFLCSDLSDYVNGEVIRVDGGAVI